MVKVERIRCQRLIKEAEGYLDLIMAFDDRWPLESAYRQTLVARALACLERVNQSTRRSQVLYLKGQAYRLIEDYERAIDLLQESAGIDSHNVRTYLALGWCFKRRGLINLAIQALESANEVDSESGIIHYNLACYWSLAGNPSSAIHHLARALEISPEYREYVASEKDFDQIRENPEFQAVLSVNV